MADRTATAEENSLSNIGFQPDANEDETASSVVTEGEETEQTEESTEEQHTEETREEGDEAEVSEEDTEAASSEEGDEATEEEEPQGYDIMLPNQQQKNYPAELYQLAAKKFGIDPSLLEQKSVKDLLKGKIDSDIDNRNLRERLGSDEEDEDTVVDEDDETVDEPARREQAVEFTPEKQIEAITRLLDGGLDGQSPIITPQGAKLFSQSMLGAYTEMQEAQESGDPKKIEAAEIKHTKTMATFATAMIANVLPVFLPSMLASMPGQTWDGIVGAKLEEREEMKETHSTARAELMKDPRYRDLGDMVKSKAIYNFVRENPEILDKKFVDADGKPIKNPIKLEMARYRYVVNQIRGQNYRPPTELVKEGIEAGKKHAALQAEKKANGRISTGKTRGGMGTTTDRYDPKNWADRMKRATDNANPLGQFLDQTK